MWPPRQTFLGLLFLSSAGLQVLEAEQASVEEANAFDTNLASSTNLDQASVEDAYAFALDSSANFGQAIVDKFMTISAGFGESQGEEERQGRDVELTSSTTSPEQSPSIKEGPIISSILYISVENPGFHECHPPQADLTIHQTQPATEKSACPHALKWSSTGAATFQQSLK